MSFLFCDQPREYVKILRLTLKPIRKMISSSQPQFLNWYIVGSHWPGGAKKKKKKNKSIRMAVRGEGTISYS